MKGIFAVSVLLNRMICWVSEVGQSTIEPVVDEVALNQMKIPFLSGPSHSGIGLLKNPAIAAEIQDGVPLSAIMSTVSPTSSMEGSFYSDLSLSMAPIVTYFSKEIGKFRTWYESVESIMSDQMRKEIVSEMYTIHSEDSELETFWAMIQGPLLVNTMPSLNESFKKLDLMVNKEKTEGSEYNYEFNELLKAQTDNDLNYLEESKFAITNLELGISRYGMRIFTEVVEPFLNSTVNFKSLQRMLGNMVGTSKSLLIN
ncbi:hypothetical protein CWI42_011960 [Ordospora colligata]|uniref:Uncharacterized protein n=1 Tax=Ordospora colligata OC4 TaxID=1354746 RepID=A0A0B2UNK4_9MICR|nr:uncharacterized protein M896_011960 [Ordospora colligata OC4]KHN70540.1 hypothetical protein M896_011960 [Ordospora colligata OC4]TBU17290.1 hypothetical protein CWI41_011960 [Ordospora colligata]TBU17540.1 hypothetical protein CWI40_011960 [Ordospora colligata]TBU19720.1 hypothetical protein CWI42_011960 [Ordospora colligata]